MVISGHQWSEIVILPAPESVRLGGWNAVDVAHAARRRMLLVCVERAWSISAGISGHQWAISGPSVGHQWAISGPSVDHQRNGPSVVLVASLPARRARHPCGAAGSSPSPPGRLSTSRSSMSLRGSLR